MTTHSRSNNWGRWGPDDQRGMLNLITPQHVLDAVRLVRRGTIYNLSVPLERGGRIFTGFHETWRVTTAREEGGIGVSGDVIMLHSHAGTHVDALAHFWRDGVLWNGKSASTINRDGVTWAGIQNVGTIVTRGVLADVAAFRGVEHLTSEDAITGQELDACLKKQGVELQLGNVLLVCTGWHRVFPRNRTLWDSGEPGPNDASADWLNSKGVVAVGADNAGVEWTPQRSHPSTFHVRVLRDLGILLLENLDLEALARDRVYEFLFMAAPLPLTNGTGAPCVPIAMA